MAAAGFSKITFSYPEPARAVIVRCPETPSPQNPPKTKEKYILEEGAWPILFLARTDLGPTLSFSQDPQRETLKLLLFQIRTPS